MTIKRIEGNLVIIKDTMLMKEEDLNSLYKTFERQFEKGLMLVPARFEVHIVNNPVGLYFAEEDVK